MGDTPLEGPQIYGHMLVIKGQALIQYYQWNYSHTNSNQMKIIWWFGLLGFNASATARVIATRWNDDEISFLVEETGVPGGNHRPAASNWLLKDHLTNCCVWLLDWDCCLVWCAGWRNNMSTNISLHRQADMCVIVYRGSRVNPSSTESSTVIRG